MGREQSCKLNDLIYFHQIGKGKLMKNKLRNWILLVCFGLLFYSAVPVFAQEGTPTPSDDEVNAVAGKLFCPVCENIPLDVCGTQACIQWRELIREQLAQGRTSVEIQQYFVERYGEQVLAEPPMRGFNGMIYWLPILMFLVGAGLLIRTLRTRRLKLVIPETESDNEIAPYVERMEAELKNYQDK
jgi:cytochrome c-type biogenesis protein CcmH